MNDKRSLVIAAVAVLAVVLSVTGSLVYPGSARSAQPIPVTGLSSSGGLSANSGVSNNWQSPIEEYIQNEQSIIAFNSKMRSPVEQYILNAQAQAANAAVNSKWKSPIEEYIQNQQYRSVANPSSSWLSPIEEHIQMVSK